MKSLLQKMLAGLVVGCVPFAVEAQLISLKTVPIATGEQFLIFPTANMGMAGVSLALDDPLLDPFINPAKAARLRGMQLHSTPTFYGVSGNGGGGRTLPAGVLYGSERAFVGFSGALQQVDRGLRDFRILPPPPGPTGPTGPTVLQERNSSNRYLTGLLGTRLGIGALGVEAFYADLNSVQGVDRLYARSQSIVQNGHVADFRVGFVRDFAGDRSFEALALHSRTRMKHDVIYADPFWDPGSQTTRNRLREETNLDRTNTWGVHLGYRRPLQETGWKMGGILTMNYKTHPKIPNYEIQNIPRDPGTSWAYNVGIGFSRRQGDVVFGIDAIYEPIWSHTWAEAAEPVTSSSGTVIPAGGRTVDNHFVFSNKLVRFGLARDASNFAFQVGMQVRSISYTLDQVNLVQVGQRAQDEAWIEWTPAWSGVLKFPEFHLRYNGHLTTNGFDISFATEDTAAAPVDFVAAPSAPIGLPNFTVWVHQLSISVPIGGR
jgi:hypothetical protein